MAKVKHEAAAKKVKKTMPLTLEERMERMERDFKFLAVKLRSHGIHLAPDAEPEPEQEEEEAE
jgi:hypothetical protein